MSRVRKPENKGLPARWTLYHGAFYYRVPVGQEAHWDNKQMFRLGATLSEAYRAWAERCTSAVVTTKTVGQLLDRYLNEVVPVAQSVTTAENKRYHLRRLKAVFGHMGLDDITPPHVYRYIDLRKDAKTGEKAPIAAHREIETLSHAYTKAVEWGLVSRHPFKGEVRLAGERPRNRYIEDWEVVEMLALSPTRKSGSVLMIQAYIRLKLLTGMARGDLLRLEPGRHVKEDGIHVQRHKTANSTGKRTIYEWDDALRAAFQMALKVRPVHISPFLFCNRAGEGYYDEATGKAAGFKSMWQRFAERVLKETTITEPFTEHDLRAKVASDAESLERARALLAHADSRTTEAVYRRKPERVRPAG